MRVLSYTSPWHTRGNQVLPSGAPTTDIQGCSRPEKTEFQSLNLCEVFTRSFSRDAWGTLKDVSTT